MLNIFFVPSGSLAEDPEVGHSAPQGTFQETPEGTKRLYPYLTLALISLMASSIVLRLALSFNSALLAFI